MPFAPAILREELSSYTDYENVCSGTCRLLYQ